MKGKQPTVRRVCILTSVGGGPARRLVRYLSGDDLTGEVFTLFSPEQWRSLMSSGRLGRLAARLGGMVVFPILATARVILERPDFIVPTTNPFFLPFLLVLSAPLHGGCTVPLVYDLYPDAMEVTGYAMRRGLVARLSVAANRFWFARTPGVIFIGARMAEHAIRRYGRPERWEVIETGADFLELGNQRNQGPAETEFEQWCEGKVIISYVGNMGQVHDWETLAKAIPRVLAADDVPPWGVVIASSGSGAEALQHAWRALPPGKVRFEPPLEDGPWARLLGRSQLSLVMLRAGAAHTSIPSKTFSAMAASNAIVAVAPEGSDLADLVRRHSCGEIICPGDVNGLAAALKRLVVDRVELERFADNARRAVLEHYDMPRLAERWRNFLCGSVAESTVGSVKPTLFTGGVA